MPDLRAKDDASLLARGPEGFRIFYERHVEAMIRYFARRGLDAQDAADMVQETFIAALEARHGYQPQQGPARAWLFGIARNKLADRGRRFGRDEAVISELRRERIELTALDVDTYASIATEEPALRALAELPEDQRETLRAKIIEEQDYAEIGKAQGISEAGVRQRVSRGLRFLRGLLEEDKE
jgi:RNA polymerase sigma factor (sigma-70 family)